MYPTEGFTATGAGEDKVTVNLRAARVSGAFHFEFKKMRLAPRCADPKGYYGQMLTQATATADSAAASSGLSALILAVGRLKTVPGIEKKLKAELDQTVGVKR
jgi:hypothetical protein